MPLAQFAENAGSLSSQRLRGARCSPLQIKLSYFSACGHVAISASSARQFQRLGVLCERTFCSAYSVRGLLKKAGVFTPAFVTNYRLLMTLLPPVHGGPCEAARAAAEVVII